MLFLLFSGWHSTVSGNFSFSKHYFHYALFQYHPLFLKACCLCNFQYWDEFGALLIPKTKMTGYLNTGKYLGAPLVSNIQFHTFGKGGNYWANA